MIREAYAINAGRSLRDAIDNTYEKTKHDWALLNKAMARFRIKALQPHSDFSGISAIYDCQDYVFDSLCLPKFTFTEMGAKINQLIEKDFPEIIYSPNPVKGGIAAYLDNLAAPGFVHYARIISIDKAVTVRSKWGTEGELLEHPLGSMLPEYGNYVMYFTLNKENEFRLDFL